MAVLTDQQRKFYEETRKVTKQEIADLENQIQEELQRVKQRIAELQAAQKAARQMYDAACQRLGIPNDMEEQGSRVSSRLRERCHSATRAGGCGWLLLSLVCDRVRAAAAAHGLVDQVGHPVPAGDAATRRRSRSGRHRARVRARCRDRFSSPPRAPPTSRRRRELCPGSAPTTSRRSSPRRRTSFSRPPPATTPASSTGCGHSTSRSAPSTSPRSRVSPTRVALVGRYWDAARPPRRSPTSSRGRFAAASRRGGTLPRRRALYVVWWEPLIVAAPGTFHDDLLPPRRPRTTSRRRCRPLPARRPGGAPRPPPRGRRDARRARRACYLRRRVATAPAPTDRVRCTARVIWLPADPASRPGPRLPDALERWSPHVRRRRETAGRPRPALRPSCSPRWRGACSSAVPAASARRCRRVAPRATPTATAARSSCTSGCRASPSPSPSAPRSRWPAPRSSRCSPTRSPTPSCSASRAAARRPRRRRSRSSRPLRSGSSRPPRWPAPPSPRRSCGGWLAGPLGPSPTRMILAGVAVNAATSARDPHHPRARAVAPPTRRPRDHHGLVRRGLAAGRVSGCSPTCSCPRSCCSIHGRDLGLLATGEESAASLGVEVALVAAARLPRRGRAGRRRRRVRRRDRVRRPRHAPPVPSRLGHQPAAPAGPRMALAGAALTVLGDLAGPARSSRPPSCPVGVVTAVARRAVLRRAAAEVAVTLLAAAGVARRIRRTRRRRRRRSLAVVTGSLRRHPRSQRRRKEHAPPPARRHPARAPAAPSSCSVAPLPSWRRREVAKVIGFVPQLRQL